MAERRKTRAQGGYDEVEMACIRAHDEVPLDMKDVTVDEDGTVRWKVHVKNHAVERDSEGRVLNAGGDFGVNPLWNGMPVILGRYANCPVCGGVGAAQVDFTVGVI